MLINLINKKQIIKDYSDNKYDTGSTRIQIILLSYRIMKLQKHFILNKKDKHSKRGLLKLISKRRKLLNYLKIKNYLKYNVILKELQLRH